MFPFVGAPHAHILLWLNAECPLVACDVGSAQWLQWVDNSISAELSVWTANSPQRVLVQRHQVHTHKPTCKVSRVTPGSLGAVRRAGDAAAEAAAELDAEAAAGAARAGHGRAAAADAAAVPAAAVGVDADAAVSLAEDPVAVARRRANAEHFARLGCRFGYPHPLCPTTHMQTAAEENSAVRGDRPLRMCRRAEEDRFVNNYNLQILQLWDANMDMQVSFS
jgi:hypothetical protein